MEAGTVLAWPSDRVERRDMGDAVPMMLARLFRRAFKKDTGL
jgi:hypothetical protein